MQIVYGGDDAFSASISGIQNPINRQYFQQQVSQAEALIGSSFGEFGQRFVQGAKDLYERFNGDRAMEIARAALNQVRGIFQADIVRTISDITQFQIATPVMQRWIMANPAMRALYHDQRCDGYSDSYVDREPTKIGEDHYDWRRVMNGAVVMTENGWYANQYAELMMPGEEELAVDEQFRILNTWDSLQNLIYQGAKDPTNVWNNDL